MDLPLSERFSASSFTPVTKSVTSFSPVVASAEGAWSATSFYLDSSGRSSFLLPLQLGCRTKEDVDRIVASKCLQPAPKNIEVDEEENNCCPIIPYDSKHRSVQSMDLKLSMLKVSQFYRPQSKGIPFASTRKSLYAHLLSPRQIKWLRNSRKKCPSRENITRE